MEVRRLDGNSKEKLRTYMLQDFSRNAIYLYDLDIEYPMKIDFSIAAEEERIRGFSAIWADNPDFCYLHIVADDEEGFLHLLKNSKSYLERAKRMFIPSEFSPIIKAELGLDGVLMYLMSLKKGDEKIEIKHPVRRLQATDLSSVIELLTEGVNLYVKDRDLRNGILKSVENSIGKGLFFGCFIKNELASFFRASIAYPPIAMADTLYTKKALQRSGAGISVVSSLIKDLFYNRNGFNEIQVYEEKENLSAFGIYSKLGFKSLKEYTRYSLTRF